ncbi:hypothetical protein FA13DRAFT_296278 [Coprinellus micaceus]|uniref:Uncharacterized protein n=1 Tax=Coprinellus micaceus TaxID=71717 RepID=A0A4Y7SE74_COPMI|nr:hypothetical protein FA13DRAFT_296278 [Coprinellus micaceus]
MGIGLMPSLWCSVADVQTAFEVWVHARRWGRVPFLVGLGANINAVFKDGQTALDVATRAEDWEGVHVLAGLKPSVNTHFQDRSTVAKVVGEEKWNLILEIIDAGADVNMPVNDGCDTVLHLACRSKCQLTVIEQLLQKGADPNAKS